LPGISINCSVSKSFEVLKSESLQEREEQGEDVEDEDAYELLEEHQEPDLVDEKVNLNIDTLCMIPDEKWFYMVWRGLSPINDLGALEVKEIKIW